MARTADVVVIGGGRHGCSTALHLALRGLKPILVDKDYAGRHASVVNAGGVRQLASDLSKSPLAISLAASRYLTHALSRAHSLSVNQDSELLTKPDADADSFWTQVDDLR